MVESELRAVVEKIISTGKHGPFAIATSKEIKGSITFSLEPTVWREKDWPEEGAVVFLTKLRMKRAGWRAKFGRYWLLSDEQTAYKEEVVKSFRCFFESLKVKFFPSAEDVTWKKWVDYKDRGLEDLINLLSSDVRCNFKRRALFLLFVPGADFNPLYWKEEVGKFYYKNNLLENIPVDLLDYVADLIIGFITVLLPSNGLRLEDVECGSDGMDRFAFPGKYHNVLNFYNRCIPYFLKVLPKEKAEKIFPLFSLIDISTFQSLDDSSGYSPFENLLYMEIDEKWKRMADARMRNIINNEANGVTKPREVWEEALGQYARIIQLQLGGNFGHSLEFLADQIQFILNVSRGRGGLISNWNVIVLFNLFSGEKFKKLRHEISRYVLLEECEDFSKFSIYSEETEQAAKKILEEFGDDQELFEKIKILFLKYEERKNEERAYNDEKNKEEAGILAEMK